MTGLLCCLIMQRFNVLNKRLFLFGKELTFGLVPMHLIYSTFDKMLESTYWLELQTLEHKGKI